jgi:trimeric autotransporter adhesin
LPNGGLDGQVFALAVKGNDLYAGGHFNQTVDGTVRNLNNIAVLSDGVWSALPHNGLTKSGPPPQVAAFSVVGDDLYVGGTFTQTADGAVQDLNNIAVLSNGAWHALPHAGLNNRVLALAFNGSELYVGGFFSATADGAVKNLGLVARYNIAGWTTLPNGGFYKANLYDGFVDAITFHGSDMVLGGFFTQTADSSVPNLNRIARLSGGAWQSLPNGGLGDDNAFVTALAYIGDDLFAGGGFHTTADGLVPDLNNIARLSGGSWSALPHQGLGVASPDPPEVSVMAVQGADLYVGGSFDKTYDSALTGLGLIAKFSGGQWSETPNGGLAGSSVDDIAISGSRLFVGGTFAATADVSYRSLNRVAVLYLDNFPQFLPIASR